MQSRHEKAPEDQTLCADVPQRHKQYVLSIFCESLLIEEHLFSGIVIPFYHVVNAVHRRDFVKYHT